jgi:hypothetical protein
MDQRSPVARLHLFGQLGPEGDLEAQFSTEQIAARTTRVLLKSGRREFFGDPAGEAHTDAALESAEPWHQRSAGGRNAVTERDEAARPLDGRVVLDWHAQGHAAGQIPEKAV